MDNFVLGNMRKGTLKLLSNRKIILKIDSFNNIKNNSKKIEVPINQEVQVSKAPINEKVVPDTVSTTININQDDIEDYIDALHPLLAKIKRKKARIRAKQKFSYLTELFYSSMYKNYHDKLKIENAVNRFKKIQKTIEKNNEEIKNILLRLEELKKENEIYKQKNTRVLNGYMPEEINKVKEELEKINDLTEQMQQN